MESFILTVDEYLLLAVDKSAVNYAKCFLGLSFLILTTCLYKYDFFFLWCWGWNPGSCKCQARALSTELHPQPEV